jgi:hypothetical protein
MKKLVFKKPRGPGHPDGSVHITCRFNKDERAQLQQYYEREMSRSSFKISLSAFVKAVTYAAIEEANAEANLEENMANEKLGVSVERFSVNKNGGE